MSLDDPERANFLAQSCAVDPDLRFHHVERPPFLPDLDAIRLAPDEAESPAFAGTERFAVKGLLGSGGFGDVYEVFDRSLNLTVALKVLRGFDPGTLENFKRGFRALDGLVHPNVCQIYELVFEPVSQLWLLTMELVHGQSLTDYMVHHSGTHRAVFRQIALGLQALHRCQILHCDIKPSNVLVTPDGHAVLLDFGLARLAGAGDSVVRAVTPAFAAPELLTGGAYSRDSDWYAVGVMLERVLPPTGFADLRRLAGRLTERDPAQRPGEGEILAILCPGEAESAPALPEVFVGRNEQLQLVEEIFQEVVAGHGLVVSIRGASGIGKTAFAKESLRRIRRSRPDVLLFHGSCHQGESVPFKALDEVVDQICGFLQELPLRQARVILPPEFALLARLFPVLEDLVQAGPPLPASPDPQELRRRAFAALAAIVDNLAGLGPVAIFVDDLQWTDMDSSLLLRELITALAARPVLWLLAQRRETDPPPGVELLHSPAIRTVELGPLTPSQSRQMTEKLLGPGFANAVSHVVSEAAGSPFLLRQLSLLARGGRVSNGVGELVADHLAKLSPPEQRLLEVLAIARTPLEQDVLRTAAGVGEQFLSARTRLVGSTLIRMTGPRGSMSAAYHDRIAELVAATIAPNAERRLHENLALALESAHAPDVESIAVHFNAAGLIEKACHYGLQAARKAADSLAFEQAARLFQSVIDWSPRPSAETAALEKARGEALVNCGHGAEAARAFSRAQEHASGEEVLRLRIRAAGELLRSGEVGEGLAALEELLAEHGLPFPRGRVRGVARLLWERLRVEIRRRRPERSVLSATAAQSRLDLCWAAIIGTSMVYPLLTEIYCFIYLRLALDSGDHNRLALGLGTFASRLAYVDDGELREARALLQQAGQLAGSTPTAYSSSYLAGMWAVVEMLAGNWEKSRDHAVRSVAGFRAGCYGATWEIASVSTYAFTARVLTGEWNANARDIPALLAEARDRGDRYAEVSLQLVTGYYATFLIADDPVLAEAGVHRCLSVWPGRDFDLQHHYAFQALVDLDLYRGRAGSAWHRVERTWPKLLRSGLMRLTLLETFAFAVRGRAALAFATEAQEPSRHRVRLVGVAQDAARRLRKSPAQYGPGLGLMLEAGVAVLRGDRASARDLLGSAENELAKSHLVPWLAVTRLGLAQLTQAESASHYHGGGMAWMNSEHIRRPECLVRMLLPGVG